MRKLTIIAFLAILSSQIFSQSKSYFSSSGEVIFSLAAIDHNGNSEGNILRFSPFFCLQTNFNYDFSKNFGSYIGLAIRNIGYIYEYEVLANNPDDPTATKTIKNKFRTYNLGLPVGLKIGVMDNVFVYGGYEIEFPFNYKEKTFDGDQKDKFNVWFSNRVEQFQHGFFAGIQLPYGANLKFKYYISNFHNMDYVNNDGIKPYDGLKANVFYFALSFVPFKDMKDSYSDAKEKNSVY